MYVIRMHFVIYVVRCFVEDLVLSDLAVRPHPSDVTNDEVSSEHSALRSADRARTELHSLAVGGARLIDVCRWTNALLCLPCYQSCTWRSGWNCSRISRLDIIGD